MKQSKKQIEANLRNKFAAQYKEKAEQLNSDKVTLKRLLNEMEKRAIKAETECDELKEKIAILEDWNNRLLECMDMSDKDRKAYIETLRAQAELKNVTDRLWGTKLFNFLWHFGSYE
jgi:hypothetical protein